MSLMQGVVERRTPHQILSNVLLDARDGMLTLTATDLDTTFVSEIETLSLAVPGAVTVRPESSSTSCATCPRQRKSVSGSSRITTSTSSARRRRSGSVSTASRRRTSRRARAAGGPTLTLPFGALRRMVEKVRFAVSTEEIRLQLQGALLKPKGTGLEMAATDGHRLALIEVEDAKADAGFEAILVSKKVLDELSRLDAEDETAVTIVRGTNHIGFTLGRRRIFSKLDDRRFPDYEKVISKENTKRATVVREELLGAVRRISLLSGDRLKAVSLSFKEGALVVSSESQDVGDGDQEIGAEYEADPVTLRLNSRYLEQFLEACETEKVHLFVKDEGSQCQGRPAEPVAGLKSYLYVVMPMRV
jgi:DNA polymerase III, beta subunit